MTHVLPVQDKNRNHLPLRLRVLACLALVAFALAAPVRAFSGTPQKSLPDHASITAALREVVKESNGGFGLHMWATLVDRDGVVQVVAMSGENRGAQWPGSRVISAQKVNTANAISLPVYRSRPPTCTWPFSPAGAYSDCRRATPWTRRSRTVAKPRTSGRPRIPWSASGSGGNVFGGGLALYASDGTLLGGLGLSGDSSVADHIIAWKLRRKLGLDSVPGGVSPTKDDNIVLDLADGKSARLGPPRDHARSDSDHQRAAEAPFDLEEVKRSRIRGRCLERVGDANRDVREQYAFRFRDRIDLARARPTPEWARRPPNERFRDAHAGAILRSRARR